MHKQTANRTEVFTMLCAWEAINDWTLTDPSRNEPDWDTLRQGVGSLELRDACFPAGFWIEAVADKVVELSATPYPFDCMSWDWDAVPMILDMCRNQDGEIVVLDPAQYPNIEQTAKAVLAKLEECHA